MSDIVIGPELCLDHKQVGTVTYYCNEKKNHINVHSDGRTCTWSGENGVWLAEAEIIRRWPRLFAAMQWMLIGTQGETSDAIRGVLTPFAGGSEAVVHFGGSKKVFQAAARARHSLRECGHLDRYIQKGTAA